ncbi:MAG: nucleotidyltransferase domain-containing protein [Clostridiales bacterium]|nr:nucleotidyltransferase domain-containing protein [Clostridiales bacterium]
MLKDEIINKINETEKEFEVKVPFAIESGSRSWGFASTDSDYDCRFIYIHKKEWYLSILEKKDIIEYDTDGVFDINGWDLKKALKHIIKSNAVMLEWLSSHYIYKCENYFKDSIQILANSFFNPVHVSYHYLSLAKSKYNELINEGESSLKKYFYILRPIANLNFIYEYKKMPHMDYFRTLSETKISPRAYSYIQELRSIKSGTGEGYKIKPHEMLLSYFKNEIELFEKRLPEMKYTKNYDYAQADKLFIELIERAWVNG